MVKKIIIAGTSGAYMGKFKGGNIWHRIPARSEAEARGKMLKGTRYISSEVSIKKYKGR